VNKDFKKYLCIRGTQCPNWAALPRRRRRRRIFSYRGLLYNYCPAL